jgi:uncharacterized membrane protein
MVQSAGSNAIIDFPLAGSVSSADTLSRPRVRYFLYYPLFLASAALLLWVFPTDRITAVSCSIATVVGCVMIWEILFTGRAIRLSSVCAFGLIMGYGFGTLNSWITLPRGGLPLAVSIGQTVPELADGVAAALMGCAILLLMGELIEKPVWTTSEKLQVTRGMKWLVFINTVIITLAFASGKFKQGGTAKAGLHSAGVLAEFIEFLLAPTAIMAGVILLAEQKRSDRYLFSAITVFYFLLMVTQGRVSLVSTVLIVVIMARYFGYDWSRLTLGRVLIIGASLIFIFAGILAYQLMRVASYSVPDRSISAEIGQIQEWAKENQAWRIATTSSAENLQTRTLLVTFLSSLLHQSIMQRPALGQDLLLQVEWAVPGAIFPDKPTTTEEVLASHTFHVFYPDQPNSLFTAGALDFGVWGVFVYPFIVVILCSLINRIVLPQLSYELVVFGAFMFLKIMIAPENQMDAYFVAIRNLLVFSLLLYVFSKSPRFQMTSVNYEVDS